MQTTASRQPNGDIEIKVRIDQMNMYEIQSDLRRKIISALATIIKEIAWAEAEMIITDFERGAEHARNIGIANGAGQERSGIRTTST